ncbi:MAG: hypothetical protein ACI9JR_001729, partial [Gammaproteobacteria bacterium]
MIEMAEKNIGIVVKLSGNAEIKSVDGVIRVVSVNDRIHEGDILTTSQNTSITLEFYNGQRLLVGANAEILLDETVYADQDNFSDDRVDQLAELQQLIVEGIDLADLEAAAAGTEQAAAALHAGSVYIRDGAESGVETQQTPVDVDNGNFNNQNTLGEDNLFVPTNTSNQGASTPVGTAPPVITTPPVDTTATATITVNNITTDNIVNASEAGGSIIVTGTVGGDAAPGDAISFTVGTTVYNGVVLAGNTFSIPVAGSDLASDTSFDVTVTGTDGAGNPFSATSTSTHTVDTTATASISVNNITTDNIVNASEAGSNINVTGTVGGDASPGDAISFTVGTTVYNGVVLAGNAFSIPVSGSDLAANTSFDITVTGTDGAGNPFSATSTSTHTADTNASASITVNNITADDIVNASEASGNINVTGTVSGDATVGDAISFTVGTTVYNSVVLAGNTFSIPVAGSDLAADTSFDVTVTGADDAGNPFSATTTSTHTVDTSASASITVNNITTDDIVNAVEASGNIDVTGTVSGDAAPGDAISFTVGTAAYNGIVLAGNIFSIPVAGSDLAADTSFDVTVTGADDAGNPFSATTTSTHTVDT